MDDADESLRLLKTAYIRYRAAHNRSILMARAVGVKERATYEAMIRQEMKNLFKKSPPARKYADGPVFRLRATYSSTFPSRQVGTVAYWAFAPFTAAGQRGIFTPLPHIHPCSLRRVLESTLIFKQIYILKVKQAIRKFAASLGRDRFSGIPYLYTKN